MAYGKGHVTGNKAEKPGSQDWYRVHAEAWIAKVEADEALKQAHAAGQGHEEKAA